MKIAEEIWSNIHKDCPYHENSLKPFIIKAMKEYANMKLDEANILASLRETNVYTTPDTDYGFSQGIESAMECITSLKDKL